MRWERILPRTCGNWSLAPTPKSAPDSGKQVHVNSSRAAFAWRNGGFSQGKNSLENYFREEMTARKQPSQTKRTSAEYVYMELGHEKKFPWGLAWPVVSAWVKVVGSHTYWVWALQLLFLFLGNDSTPFALLPLWVSGLHKTTSFWGSSTGSHIAGPSLDQAPICQSLGTVLRQAPPSVRWCVAR